MLLLPSFPPFGTKKERKSDLLHHHPLISLLKIEEPLHDALMGQDEDLVMAAAASPGMKYGSVEPAKNGELAPRESQSSGGT